jgi:hypothetical protein
MQVKRINLGKLRNEEILSQKYNIKKTPSFDGYTKKELFFSQSNSTFIFFSLQSFI